MEKMRESSANQKSVAPFSTISNTEFFYTTLCQLHMKEILMSSIERFTNSFLLTP